MMISYGGSVIFVHGPDELASFYSLGPVDLENQYQQKPTLRDWSVIYSPFCSDLEVFCLRSCKFIALMNSAVLMMK